MDSFARSQIDALQVRVEDLERHVRRLSEHLGVKAPSAATSSGDTAGSGAPPDDEILSLLQAGKTVQAISAYVDKTGADLSHAKAAVERLKAEHGIR
ncbi:MAG: hypothetical protein M3198_16155 [Actinomycetota bacterium]|nr:hypothetical protein [Actinomycetota bacterium]